MGGNPGSASQTQPVWQIAWRSTFLALATYQAIKDLRLGLILNIVWHLECCFEAWMKRFLHGVLAALGLVIMLQSTAALALESGAGVAVVRTNLVDRWITNTTEVQMQVNRFVTEYHSNWVAVVHTNVVNLYSTNLLTTYTTNHIVQIHTNVVDVLATNLIARTLTNRLILDKYETNFVQAYQTNLKVLNLTNWTTVLAFKTNWVTKPLTNLVEIEMARDNAAAPPAAAAIVPSANVPPIKTPAPAEALSLQALRNAKTTANNMVEVQLKATWTQAPEAPVQVQQWRIEREDGSILCFGQDTEFRRALPAGTYRVLLKAQRNSQGPLLAAIGTLTVTPREVVLEQRTARNSSI